MADVNVKERDSLVASSASEQKKGTCMLPFISVQHTLYPVLCQTAYKYGKRAVIS